jgi:hypothetical protein
MTYLVNRLCYGYIFVYLAHPKGRIPDAIRSVGRGAVLPRGFAIRAGAASGIKPLGTTAEA